MLYNQRFKPQKLKKYAKVQGGYAFKSSEYTESGIPIVRIGDLKNNTVDIENCVKVSNSYLDTCKNFIIKDNELLIAMTGATVGKVAFVKNFKTHLLLNQRVGRFICDSAKIDSKYLYYVTSAQEFYNEVQILATGAGQPNISPMQIENINIPVPDSIEEQQEIVQVLDTMSDIIRLREECISHAQDLIPALFQEMFGDVIQNKKNINKIKLGKIFILSSGKFLPAKEMDETGIYPVFGGNGINGYHNEYLFDEPKLCIGRVGVKCGCVHLTKPKSWITDNALYINKLLKPINIIYLKEALTQINLNQYAKRAAQPVISQSTIYNQYILEPPIELQEQFAQKAIEIESYIKEQNEELENAKQMFQSLLHHAFTGELTHHKFGGDANG